MGETQGRLLALESDMQELRRDVREIRDALVTVRGGWTLLSAVIGLSASLGAIIGKWLPVMMGAKS
jgi:hypothetical protein